MSGLGVKLFEEREAVGSPDDLSLIRAVRGDRHYDPGMNQDAALAEETEAALLRLEDSNPFGLLQRYDLQERFLYGKRREEVGQQLARHMALLLQDLETTSIRFLRHPRQGKALLALAKSYEREME